MENEMHENEIQNANNYGIGRWQVKRNGSDDGWEVVALKRFNKGELVHSALKMGDNDVRTVHTLQKDWNKHIDIDIPGSYLALGHRYFF